MSLFTVPPGSGSGSGSTADGTSHADALSERAAFRCLARELPDELRSLRAAALAETLAAGRPVRPAAVTAVLSAHDERADDTMVWTREHVEELLWIGIDEFCRGLEVERPDGCPDALHAVLAVATRSGLLRPGSDRACALFSPLRELGHDVR